jgi:hypothetical protein
VIEKLIKEKEQPYRHLVSGQHALVNDPLDFIVAAPTELIQPWLLGDAAARSIDLALKDKLAQSQREIASIGNAHELLELRSKLEKASARADAQQTRNTSLEAELNETQEQLARARSDLNTILNSTSWRATAALRHVASLIRK